MDTNTTTQTTDVIYIDATTVPYVARNLACYAPGTISAELLDAEISIWIGYANEHADSMGYDFRFVHDDRTQTVFRADAPGVEERMRQIRECRTVATAECEDFDTAMDQADDIRKYNQENA